MIVLCDCGAKLRVDDAKIPEKGARIRCPRCGTILTAKRPVPSAVETPAAAFAPPTPVPSAPASPPGPSARSESQEVLVLVAHESEPVRAMIQGVLSDAGFAADTAADGMSALKKAVELRPRAIVLDVGLPGIYGFELCERLKGDEQTKDIKIILLASVYDAGRYKRSPVSLYGADDYIEKHQIAELLPLKIRRLLFPEEYTASGTARPPREEPPARAKQETGQSLEFRPESLLREADEPVSQTAASPVQESPAISPDSLSVDSSIFDKREEDIPRLDGSDPDAVEKAKRLARIIVSDIALYNQEAVAEGIRNGTFFELLKEDIEEGRRLYEKRVPEAIRSRRDYYQEAFDNFISAQKKIVR